MTSFLRSKTWVVAGGLVALIAAACGSAESESAAAAMSGAGGDWWYPSQGGGAGAAGSSFSGAGGTFVIPADAATITFNRLCGVRTCDPGYRKACPGTLQPTPHPDAAAPEAAAADAAAPTDVSDAPTDAAADGKDAADSSSAPDATAKAAPDATADTTSPEADAPSTDAQVPELGCYIEKTGSELVPTCAPAGLGPEGSPCKDSHDCEPGLGCVDMSLALECASALACPDSALTPRGECKQLYCAFPVACPASTFYQELPLRMAGETSPYKVPVCAPIDGCDMLSPTSCSGGRVCTIVGDNATTCLLPGDALRDEQCDDQNRCAAGLVCSKSTSTCMKLCRIGSTDCPGGTCQGGSAAFPQGLGVCLGDRRDTDAGLD